MDLLTSIARIRATMSTRKRQPAKATNAAQDVVESLAYVKAWARDLVAAAGKREARRILDDYKAIARNKELPKADRDIAVLRQCSREQPRACFDAANWTEDRRVDYRQGIRRN